MFSLSKISRLNKKRKRIGRGGKLGATSTRGFGGQKARTGDSNVRVGFEGGQMPIYRRLPKRGFNNAQFRQEFEIINIGQLESFFDAGSVVNLESLVEKGLIKRLKQGQPKVKILSNGTLSKSLTVHADAFSKSAHQAIEAQGGKARLNEEKKARGDAQ